MDKNIVFACGGSGGHLFPAQEIASRLSSNVYFMGAGLKNSAFLNREQFNYIEIPSSPLNSWTFFLTLIRSTFLSIQKLRKIKPTVVVGFGSYHSFPILLAALVLRIPIDLFEMNAAMGVVNRFFSRFSRQIYTCFLNHPKALPMRPPIRVLKIEKETALKRYHLNGDKPTVLIFGGSQGAKVFEHLTIPNTFQVIHFTGKHVDLDALKKRYEKEGIRAFVASYENEMHYAWSAADIAITRSGAMTIAEARAYQIPCLMIPYPYAKDQHQLKNAEFAAKHWQAGIVLPQEALSRAGSFLKELWQKRDQWFQSALQNSFLGGVEDYLEGILFLGVGGIGMSSLAIIAKKEGYKVIGYDDHLKEGVRRQLEKEGILILQQLKQPLPCSKVVRSSAVQENHSGILFANKRGIPILHRSEFLAEWMHKKKTICVAGTHGKTSVSGLLAYAFEKAGLHPSFMVGGYLKNFQQNGRWDTGDSFVVEADESDGSFLNYHPQYSIITNLEEDHLDYWKDLHSIERGFLQFFSQTQKQVFWCFEDDHLRKLYQGKGISYGFSKDADICLTVKKIGENSQLEIAFQEKLFCLNIPNLAQYQVLNFGAVISLFLHLNMEIVFLEEVISSFQGVSRRMDFRGHHSSGFRIYDDYAHHPTEIIVTYQALKQKIGQEPYVVFQPHRFSRTEMLFPSFVEHLKEIKNLIVTDIYAAGETKATLNAQSLVKAIGEPCQYVPKEKLKDFLISELDRQDVLVTMGAGDITELSQELVYHETKKIKS